MHWFGAKPFSRTCEKDKQVPTPVGEKCFRCEEPIEANDFGYVTPYLDFDKGTRLVPYHYACFLRGAIGSLAHVRGECSCYVPGSSEHDPPGMTVRQAAEAAVREWEQQRVVSIRAKCSVN